MTVRAKKKARKRRNPAIVLAREELDLFREDWLALTPAQRLERSWALRERIPDPEAVHDAKLFPKP